MIESATLPSSTARVDVVIPRYNEQPDAVAATLQAVLAQSTSVGEIVVVDDCSDAAISLEAALASRIRLVRLPENAGVSAARNAGIRHCRSQAIACVNVEVIPASDWIAACLRCLAEQPAVGAVGARTIPGRRYGVLGRWRMRFQERPYPVASGAIDWLGGHAVVFRSSALRAVDGFDESMRKAGEDVDICRRMREAGWEVHFLASVTCRSIQRDSLDTLAKAEYNRFCWTASTGNGFLRCLGILSSRAAQRSIRHLAFLRWAYLPVELGIWTHAVLRAWRQR